MLEVKNLSYHYPDGKNIFSDVSFSLKKGDVLSILGKNGAGKSTLLNCLANLFMPQNGQIMVDEQDLRQLSLAELAKFIGYVPQNHNPTYDYEVIDFVVMGRTPYIGFFSNPSPADYRLAEKALEDMKIGHLAYKPYTQISGGERQQATIARVIAQNPQIILLDEPTAHLDFGNQLRAIELVKQLADMGYTVIMTTHTPDHVFYLGGYVGLLDKNGYFRVGLPEDIMTESELSDLYDIDLAVSYYQQARRNICVALG